MPRALVLTVFLLVTLATAHAQQPLPSAKPSRLSGLDSMTHKTDSTIQKFSGLGQALTHPKTNQPSDTLSKSVARYTRSLDSTKRGMQHKIDSLEKLHLPATAYRRKLDSLERIDPLKVVRQQEAKLAAAERSATTAVTGLERNVNQEINSITKENGLTVPGVNVPGANVPSVPGANLTNSLSLPNTQVPSLNTSLTGNAALTGAEKDMSSASGLPQKELGELKNIDGVAGAEKDLGEAGQLAKKATGYEKQVSGAVKGDSASRAQLANKLESDAKNMGEMKQLTKETQVLDSYKSMTGAGGNPQALEKEAMSQAPQQAVNHFAGKEQALAGAMSKVSQLKQKYKNVTSLNDLPKRVPNEMHGKPLIERIIPGISFVPIKVNNRVAIDFNPWIGYRITGHITAGAGWNERVGVSHAHVFLEHVYGPRVFGEYKLGKGFSARMEVETMNTAIPPNWQPLHGDPTGRIWVWNSFAGLKREYKLFKYLKGNIQMLYNTSSLFAHHHVNIYGDPLTVRMGFEFPMKKNK
jgi:hypothetical protein